MIRTVAPYRRLLTAADLRWPDRSPVASAAAYLGWHRQHLVDAGAQALEWTYAGPVDARVNHGRWIVDCPNCKSGALTHPDWRIACCGECGCVMPVVTVPTDADVIAALLLRRPTREVQNWFPHESVQDLERENAQHGV